MSLRQQVAIVTGASRGLGAAVAARLLADGAHVVVTGRDETALTEAEAALRRARPDPSQRVLAVAGDVSVEADVERLMATVDRELGRLDILVSNAGVYGPLGPIDTVDWAAWVHAIEINLLGTVLCCRLALPLLRRQGRGKIIVLSGGGATAPLPRISAYAASKAGVVRFAETLAHEVQEDRIDVNCVAPGALNTRLLDEVLAAGREQVGASFYERALKQQEEGGTPLARGADLIAFLASSASDGISGRLLSAVWDDWAGLPAHRAPLARSDVYTLRRIVPEDRVGWDAE